jgi:nucleotide sugar dehydrogenase
VEFEMNIGLIGCGFVGGSLLKSFELKGVSVTAYDKYKSIGSIEYVAKTDIVFMCLPTPFVKDRGFCKDGIYENLDKLEKLNFSGLVVIKSTVEPGFTNNLNTKFSFGICHNPEFLTARTAFEDFHTQKHIVLGKAEDSKHFSFLADMFGKLYPDAEISICSSDESESMKLFCNNFYAMKVMIFNEFYDLCSKREISYDKVIELMLKNNWINPMHTKVPGPDGSLAYGGACFCKDTNALNEFSKRNGIMRKVLDAAIQERDSIREDNDNVIENENTFTAK